MKKSMIIIAAMALAITACGGNTTAETTPATTTAATEAETTAADEEKETAANAADEETDGFEELEMLGEFDVDRNLFDVVITVPADFMEDATQEELDEFAKERGYKSIELHEDGSATYTMSKAQHQEMMDAIKESIDESLNDMITSGDYPNFVSITPNKDYTSFEVVTQSEELGLGEMFSVFMFYTCGGLYNNFNGTPVDNIHVDFINADSGEIINTADSKDMGE